MLLRHARRLLRVLVVGVAVTGLVMPAAVASAAPGPSVKSIQQQIKTQSDALEKVVEQYDQVTEQLKANEAAAKKLLAQLAPTQAAMAAAQDGIAAIATEAYMTGPVDSLTALISSDNTSDLLNQLSAIDQVAAAQQQQINGYEQLQASYNTQKQRLDGLIAVQTSQRKDLAAKKTTIKSKLTKLYAMRAQAYGSSHTSSGRSHAVPPYTPGRGGSVVSFAYAQLGKPYAWAKAGPNSYDCSGLALAAYARVGVSLPHNARMQWGVVHHIPRSELSPGDLVFYSGLAHVAIYVGGGKIIHAPTFGEDVKISSVDMMSPYGYGRP